MKIKSIRLSRLRNAEHYQYHSEVNDLVLAATAESLNIPALFPAYQQHLQDEGTAINVILKSEFTDDLTTTNTSAWINEIEAKNSAFENLARTRYTKEANKNKLGNVMFEFFALTLKQVKISGK